MISIREFTNPLYTPVKKMLHDGGSAMAKTYKHKALNFALSDIASK